jgi:DNA-binding SARP family transcriptional activator
MRVEKGFAPYRGYVRVNATDRRTGERHPVEDGLQFFTTGLLALLRPRLLGSPADGRMKDLAHRRQTPRLPTEPHDGRALSIDGRESASAAPGRSPRERFKLHLQLLGGFRLTQDEVAIDLPRGSERLLAFLAIHEDFSRRGTVVSALWPGSDDRRRFASLRSALVRLHGVGCPLVDVRRQALRLTEDVWVDLTESRELAHRLIDEQTRSTDVVAASIATLSLELLPGWSDDWMTIEAEDWRQLRLHALESLSTLFTRKGRIPDALAAALAAVRGDSLRETARLAVVRAHLAENNRSEALREFQRFRRLLYEELRLEPSASFVKLIDGGAS